MPKKGVGVLHKLAKNISKDVREQKLTPLSRAAYQAELYRVRGFARSLANAIERQMGNDSWTTDCGTHLKAEVITFSVKLHSVNRRPAGYYFARTMTDLERMRATAMMSYIFGYLSKPTDYTLVGNITLHPDILVVPNLHYVDLMTWHLENGLIVPDM